MSMIEQMQGIIDEIARLELPRDDEMYEEPDPVIEANGNSYMEMNGPGSDDRPASTHPMQPLEMVDDVLRFKQNTIVRALVDRDQEHGGGLNRISVEVLNGLTPVEDYTQLMQLIGYSVSGYGDLTIVPKADRIKADDMATLYLEALHSLIKPKSGE